MNFRFDMRTLLRLLICLFTYAASILLYPYNFYYGKYFLAGIPFGNGCLLFLGFFGFALVLFFLLEFVIFLMQKLNLVRNLVVLFFTVWAVSGLTALGLDKLIGLYKIEPNEMYLLLGFCPAVLYSVLYSYFRDHPKDN